MIIDGKAIAEKLLTQLKGDIDQLHGRRPCLAVIIVGKNPASHVYINIKAKTCERIGIISQKLEFPESFTQIELLELIRGFNEDPTVDGILVQMPLPSHIDPAAVTHAIAPEKDVDGFHPLNAGKLALGETDGFVPCTPLGVMKLLEGSSLPTEGKHAVVLGRSNIVGKPMAALLLAANATVTTAHSKTENLTAVCQTADILVSAIGIPGKVTADMVKPGAIVIDVGINKTDDDTNPRGYRLVGDVDFEAVKEKAKAITPVPGGVGPMTIAMLMYNTIRSYNLKCAR